MASKQKRRSAPKTNIFECIYPNCSNSGFCHKTRNKKLKDDYNPFKYRMHKFPVSRVAKFVEFLSLNFEEWNKNLQKKIGVNLTDSNENDVYLCDGHFSADKYLYMEDELQSGELVQMKLKNKTYPDILVANPPPLLCKTFNILRGKETVEGINQQVSSSAVFSVPTKFNVKVGKCRKLEDDSFDDLVITTHKEICCFCALPAQSDRVSLVNDTNDGCTDFGRILSIMLSLTEAEVLSPYACRFCSEKVVACFVRMVDINVKASLAPLRLDDKHCVSGLPEELPCPRCSYVTPHPAEYKDHMLEHVMGRNWQSPESDDFENDESSVVTEEDGLTHQDHAYIAPPDPPGLCDICGKQVDDPIAFEKHRAHHKFVDGTKLCPICGETKKAGAMQSHIARHDDDFLDPVLKRKRQYSHVNKNFFRCIRCDIVFDTIEKREEHKITVHGGQRKVFQCYHCTIVCSSRMQLKGHLKRNHPDTIVARCEDCMEDFYHENALLLHNAAKHPELHKYYMQKKKETTIPRSQRRGKRRTKAELTAAEESFLSFAQSQNVIERSPQKSTTPQVRSGKFDGSVSHLAVTKNKTPSPKQKKAVEHHSRSGKWKPTPEPVKSSERRRIKLEKPELPVKGSHKNARGKQGQNVQWDSGNLEYAVPSPVEYKNFADVKKEYAYLDANNVEYMEQVAAEEYLILEQNTIKKRFKYM